MTKAIVTTSIHGPTDAIRKFAAMEGWQLIDVLDRKSPEESGGEKLLNVIYLSCADQEKIDRKLSDLIGWNCIQRRNFGFIYAIKELKADIVATVDDDNVPMDDWGKSLLLGREVQALEYDTSEPAFDPIQGAGNRVLWHRGFPIQLLLTKEAFPHAIMKKGTFDVQADFWNGEPDVDAICRMLHRTGNCKFSEHFFPFSSTKPSPFNSQNTFLTAKVIPEYFMFPGVGRLDDIFAAYHVEAQGFKVVYGKPSVVQKRNEHNITKDFMSEVWGYEKCIEIVKEVPTVKSTVLSHVPDPSRHAFDQYQTHFY